MLLPGWDEDQACQGEIFVLSHGKRNNSSKEEKEEGPGEVTGRPGGPHSRSPASSVFQKLSYLLVGVRPVKAQEEVGGLTMQKEVGCPEWDGEALDGVAEVKRGPEVLGISVCKDVLQGKGGAQSRAWLDPPTPRPRQCLAAPTCRGQGPASRLMAFLPSPQQQRDAGGTTQGLARGWVQTGWGEARWCSCLTRR